MIDNRRNWTRQQDLLRKALSSKAHFEQAIPLFFTQHAAVHAVDVYPGAHWSVQDEAISGLPDELFRACPRPGENPIAWLIWHITRIEDLTMNRFVFKQEQVLLRENWGDKLGLTLRDVGTGMDMDEVIDFTSRVNIQALIDYRAAVGQSTREGAARLRAEDLKTLVPTSLVQQFLQDGSINPKGAGLAQFYTGRKKGFFLTRTATSHNFIHLQEAVRVRAKLLSK